MMMMADRAPSQRGQKRRRVSSASAPAPALRQRGCLWQARLVEDVRNVVRAELDASSALMLALTCRAEYTAATTRRTRQLVPLGADVCRAAGQVGRLGDAFDSYYVVHAVCRALDDGHDALVTWAFQSDVHWTHFVAPGDARRILAAALRQRAWHVWDYYARAHADDLDAVLLDALAQQPVPLAGDWRRARRVLARGQLDDVALRVAAGLTGDVWTARFVTWYARNVLPATHAAQTRWRNARWYAGWATCHLPLLDAPVALGPLDAVGAPDTMLVARPDWQAALRRGLACAPASRVVPTLVRLCRAPAAAVFAVPPPPARAGGPAQADSWLEAVLSNPQLSDTAACAWADRLCRDHRQRLATSPPWSLAASLAAFYRGRAVCASRRNPLARAVDLGVAAAGGTDDLAAAAQPRLIRAWALRASDNDDDNDKHHWTWASPVPRLAWLHAHGAPALATRAEADRVVQLLLKYAPAPHPTPDNLWIWWRNTGGGPHFWPAVLAALSDPAPLARARVAQSNLSWDTAWRAFSAPHERAALIEHESAAEQQQRRARDTPHA